MGVYDTLAAGALKTILALASDTVRFRRVTSGNLEPDADFDPDAEPESTQVDVRAVTVGVEQEYVDGDVVQADDLQVIMPPQGTDVDSEATVAFDPQITDELLIGGKTHRINKIERIPASGNPPVCYMVFCKS